MKAITKLIHFEKNFEKASRAHQLKVFIVLFSISIVFGAVLAQIMRVNEVKQIERTLKDLNEAQKKQMNERLEILRQSRYAKEEAN